MANVAPPISTMVSMNVNFRPIRSPNRPKNKAPNGRTSMPAAKVARVAKKAAVGLPDGKNFVEMIVARLPKI